MGKEKRETIFFISKNWAKGTLCWQWGSRKTTQFSLQAPEKFRNWQNKHWKCRWEWSKNRTMGWKSVSKAVTSSNSCPSLSILVTVFLDSLENYKKGKLRGHPLGHIQHRIDHIENRAKRISISWIWNPQSSSHSHLVHRTMVVNLLLSRQGNNFLWRIWLSPKMASWLVVWLVGWLDYIMLYKCKSCS